MPEIKTIKEAMNSNLTPVDAIQVFRLTNVDNDMINDLKLNRKLGYRFVKRTFDIVSSGCGMIILSPLIVGITIAVKCTSPGPVVFKQQRVGKNKNLFNIYKFRTMRIDAPDVPSHMINANKWMTPIGATLRKFSLDELPQLWNIFKGDMSVIGPRPALWNQFDLVAERDKYGANNIRPGLTGWAQINGRDELTIEAKSALDGEYVRNRSVGFDLKCFFGTFSKLSGSEVVETTFSGHDGEER